VVLSYLFTTCSPLYLNYTHKPEIQKLLDQYSQIFSKPVELPPRRDCDHSIPLSPDAKVVNQRPYRISHHQKNALEEIIKDLLQKGVIRDSASPYSSPVVLVKKRDNTWRKCTDYRKLNMQTIKNKYPIPIIEDLLDELHGAALFSKIDLRSGYHQVRMKEEDISKTAFTTHQGHYEYVVMPFGLTNAPATFQQLMNSVLAPILKKFALVFFDDILIYITTLDEHVMHLQQVFQLLEKSKLYAKKSKCTFGTDQVEYLGHIISLKVLPLILKNRIYQRLATARKCHSAERVFRTYWLLQEVYQELWYNLQTSV
jgi:hypothetical protein